MTIAVAIIILIVFSIFLGLDNIPEKQDDNEEERICAHTGEW